MNFKKPNIQKLVSFLFIVGVLAPVLFVFSIPRKAGADALTPIVTDFVSEISLVYVGGSSSTTAAATTEGTIAQNASTLVDQKTWYEEILDQLWKAVARKVLQELTKSVVGWVNNGFHGSPLFLENAESFFTDIVKSEVKTIVDQYGYDSRKFPFGKDFALNTIKAYRSGPIEGTQYTLSTVIKDPIALGNFQNNFNVGGWNGFLINTQYPQNNYLGFQMLANEDLARKISSTQNVNNKITQYKGMLQQGQGFLSPQTCPSNPAYNNGTNEFQKPTFSYKVEYNPPLDAVDAYDKQYKANEAAAKESWAIKNTCPGGLQATTPGSVVGAQVAKAVGATQDATLVAIGAGDAISAILGAVLDKFLQEGLNALASKVNKPAAADTWTYGGESLDGNVGSNKDPYGGFDEVVILKDFKKLLNGYFIGSCTLPVASFSDTPVVEKDIQQEDCAKTGGTWRQNTAGTDYISGDIANTDTEIHLMDCNPDDANCSKTLGIIQTIGEIWGKTKTLDQCLPGPDKSWENRLKEEQNRITQKINQGNSSLDDNLKVRAAADIIRELKFATDSFKDWINTKMIQSLPGAILYMDEVNKINDFPQQLTSVTDTRRAKSSTLARLQAINQGLDEITVAIAPLDQPDHVKNLAEEAKLIALKKQYNSLKASISSTYTIENTRNDLLVLTETSKKLEDPKDPTKGLIPQCKKERTAALWGEIDTSGRGNSSQNGITEIAKFCGVTNEGAPYSGPIASGFSHGDIIRRDSTNGGDPDNPSPQENFTFRNPRGNDKGDPGYTTLPMVDAKWVLGDFLCTGSCSLAKGSGGSIILPDWRHLQEDARISIDMDCRTIFKANSTDYTHAGDLAF
jgi:hypothetical protein